MTVGSCCGVLTLALLGASAALADDSLRSETRLDLAVARYHTTGAGVVVAIFDSGIDYTHPDFIKSDGNTRIKWILDMTGQAYCDGANPPPVEYSEAQINAALHGGPLLNTRDAVGRGTVSAGVAAGNGRAFASGKYAGIAPEADLIIIKARSDGAPAHDGRPAENFFVGCADQALDWLDQKITALNRPCVAVLAGGAQWGPIDGTSAVSRKIDQVFGNSRPGRIFISASGDEGSLPAHSRVGYGPGGDGVVRFIKTTPDYAQVTAWYTGAAPANVTVAFEDGTVVTCPPGVVVADPSGITISQYNPGAQFYPWTSTGPDRAVSIDIYGRSGLGWVAFSSGTAGTADVYTIYYPLISLTDGLTPGRLCDAASTPSALVDGCYVLRTAYTDIDGIARDVSSEGSTGHLWEYSSGGPTRDGRRGLDACTPGQNVFAAYAANSFDATIRNNLVQDGGGWYGRHVGTGASAPILAGACALMLQLRPGLTAAAARQAIHSSARADALTGAVPSNHWGFGKVDILGALVAVDPCPADSNHDGVVTPSDVATSVGVWYGSIVGGNLAGDFDGDGAVGPSDLSAFVGVWFTALMAGGC